MPAALVTEFITAIENGRLEHAISLLGEDCEYDNVPLGKTHGRDAVRGTLEPFLAGFEQVEWVVHHQIASGTLESGVVMNERLDRFGKGGVWLEMPVAGLFIVEHGEITLWRDYFDRDTLMKLLAR